MMKSVRQLIYLISKKAPLNDLNKKLDLEITLTNNEIKDIIKIIRSLGNRGILLKQTYKKIATQEGGFLIFLRPLMKTALPLMKNGFPLLAESVLALPAATDAAIQKKKKIGSGTTALIISKQEIDNVIKIVKSLEESGSLIIFFGEAIQNEVKEQKRGIFWYWYWY